MNKCREFRKLIIRHFSKDLKNEEEDLLMVHLAQCPACQQEFDLQQEIETMLEHRPLDEAPAGLVERVLLLIPERESVYARPSFSWRPVAAVAFGAAGFILAAIVVYLKPQPVLFSGWTDGLTTALSHWSFDIKNPFIMWGAVAYSVIFSLFSLLIIQKFRHVFAKGFALLDRVI